MRFRWKIYVFYFSNLIAGNPRLSSAYFIPKFQKWCYVISILQEQLKKWNKKLVDAKVKAHGEGDNELQKQVRSNMWPGRDLVISADTISFGVKSLSDPKVK